MVYARRTAQRRPLRRSRHLSLPPNRQPPLREQSVLDLHLTAQRLEQESHGPGSQQHLLRHARLPLITPPKLPRSTAVSNTARHQRPIQAAR